MAYLHCNILGKGTTAVEATANAAQIINDVRHSLLGLNIVGEDIVNMSYNTHSTYDNKGKLTGYKAETSLRITVRELEKLGNVIDKIIASGVNNINGITYTLGDRNLYRRRIHRIHAVNMPLHLTGHFVFLSIRLSLPCWP